MNNFHYLDKSGYYEFNNIMFVVSSLEDAHIIKINNDEKI